jgi:hypothetical protein
MLKFSSDCQFGQPKQILDMGHTSIDEDIWQEFLAEMRLHYTADKVRVRSTHRLSN